MRLTTADKWLDWLINARQRLSALEKEFCMLDLNVAEVEMVSGGAMSTETRMEIAAALVLCPILGVGMLVGYYANAK